MEDSGEDNEAYFVIACNSVEEIRRYQYRDTLLKMLGLEKFFPGKIDFWEVTKIKSKKKGSELHNPQLTDIPWEILQKLIMIDFTGRESPFTQLNRRNAEGDRVNDMDYFLKDQAESMDHAASLNPLDAFLVTFLCCNPMLRQIIIGKMF